jgi:hypothetical protein
MLPPGLEKCPNCGKKLRSKNSDEWTLGDIFSLSATVLGFALIPLVIAVVIGLLCIYLAR